MHNDKDNIKIDNSSVTSDSPKLHPLWRFLYLLISPLNGWKRMKNASYAPDNFARQLFYPSLAVIALFSFIDLYYIPDISLVQVLQKAIAVFVAFFIGYFAIQFLAEFVLPKEAKIKIATPFGKIFIMTSLTALAFFYLIYEIIPGISVLLTFTPIYVAYIIFKGVKFIRVPNSELIISRVVLIILIIGIPIAIFSFLEAIMPAVEVQQSPII